MDQRDPNLVHSGLSRTVTKDGVTVEVSIVRLENETAWSLEVVNSSGSSIVWDDQSSSDKDALAEFERTVAEEGISTFLDGGKVIPFRCRLRIGLKVSLGRNPYTVIQGRIPSRNMGTSTAVVF
jgi:hypothetical protein